MSNITLGPNAEVEIDEQTGELIIKTDADNVTFEQSNVNFDGNADHQGNDINNVGSLSTESANIESEDAPTEDDAISQLVLDRQGTHAQTSNFYIADIGGEVSDGQNLNARILKNDGTIFAHRNLVWSPTVNDWVPEDNSDIATALELGAAGASFIVYPSDYDGDETNRRMWRLNRWDEIDYMASPTIRGGYSPVIDDFNHGSLDSKVYDPDDFTFDSGEFLSGRRSLRTDADGTQRLLSRIPAYRGFRYRLYYRFDAHGTQDSQWIELGLSEFEFARSGGSGGDGYTFRSRIDGDSEIYRYDFDTANSLASTATNSQLDAWQVLEVDVEFEELVMRSKQLDGTMDWEISANDAQIQDELFFSIELRSDDHANNNRTYVDMIQRRPL